VGDIKSEVALSHFGQVYRVLDSNCKREYFAKFLVETRLKSESFESLIAFLRCLVE